VTLIAEKVPPLFYGMSGLEGDYCDTDENCDSESVDCVDDTKVKRDMNTTVNSPEFR
jgi:hypothetical protein